EVAIARDHFRNGRHVRIKFSAPLAAAAAAYCTLRGRTFVCRACDARYDYSSRHTARYTPALNRLLSLQRRNRIQASIARLEQAKASQGHVQAIARADFHATSCAMRALVQ